MIDDEERERRRRYIEQARELNEAAMRKAEDARDLDRGRDLIRHADDYYFPPTETESDRDDRLYRYGIALRDPHGLERWRAHADARRLESEARELREVKQLRLQQQRAAQADEGWNAWVERLGGAQDQSSADACRTK